jgi:hypothetical protein
VTGLQQAAAAEFRLLQLTAIATISPVTYILQLFSHCNSSSSSPTAHQAIPEETSWHLLQQQEQQATAPTNTSTYTAARMQLVIGTYERFLLGYQLPADLQEAAGPVTPTRAFTYAAHQVGLEGRNWGCYTWILTSEYFHRKVVLSTSSTYVWVFRQAHKASGRHTRGRRVLTQGCWVGQEACLVGL